MRIAFDCSGTLLPGTPKVLALWKWFEAKGCEMMIWSASYGYTQDAKNKHNLIADCMTKSYGSTGFIDICVDDRNDADILDAKHLILVDEIPHPDKFEEVYGTLLEKKDI